MAEDDAKDDRLMIVLVDRVKQAAIVPTGGDARLPETEGSVTVEAVGRAARRLGRRRRRGSIAAIAEATIDRSWHIIDRARLPAAESA